MCLDLKMSKYSCSSPRFLESDLRSTFPCPLAILPFCFLRSLEVAGTGIVTAFRGAFKCKLDHVPLEGRSTSLY